MCILLPWQPAFNIPELLPSPLSLQLCRYVVWEEVAAGKWLWKHGDAADRACVILSGSASVWTHPDPGLSRMVSAGGRHVNRVAPDNGWEMMHMTGPPCSLPPQWLVSCLNPKPVSFKLYHAGRSLSGKPSLARLGSRLGRGSSRRDVDSTFSRTTSGAQRGRAQPACAWPPAQHLHSTAWLIEMHIATA